MISIITITYNRSELLQEALTSVLLQTYKDFEYIIVDDGSTDNTKDIIAQCKDKRVSYIYQNNTGYLSKARNRGLEEASGEIVAFLDSDDYWHPDYLLELKKVYQDKDVLSLISNATVFSENERYCLLDATKLPNLRGSLLREHLLNDNLIIYPSCFSFRFSKNERLNTDLKHGENDLILKLMAAGDSYIGLKELVYIRKHNNNISGEKTYNSLFIQGYYEEYRTLDDLLQQGLIDRILYHKAYSRYLFKQAEKTYSIGLKRKAWKKYLQSFLKYPLQIRALFRLIRFDRFL
jgi:glycosyltransferase involved in cell wall biosynthesis